jgi:isoleucyl-tRNA synthetase
VILAQPEHQHWLAEHAALIREELNVHDIEFARQADQYISYTVLPDLKRLGPRLGKQLPQLKAALAAADPAALLAQLDATGAALLPLATGEARLERDDIQIRMQAKPGWTAAQGPEAVVVLSTEITPELEREGFSREVVHAIQNRRKDLNCEYTERIAIGLTGDGELPERLIAEFGDYIRGETLAQVLQIGPIEGAEPIELELSGQTLRIFAQRFAP